jgi:anti-sigma regulatory factor (Ser/Thr protein kinase)
METLAEFALPSEPGNERLAVQRVFNAVEKLSLPQENLDRLGTAVAEATMNAMEHGNKYRSDTPVEITVASTKNELIVRIRDHGGGKVIFEYVSPDLYAKLSGQQSPRGWGLFLIQNMVDDIRITSDGKHRTLELIIKLNEIDHGESI